MTQKPEVESEIAGYRRMAGEVYDILQRTQSQQQQRPHEYSEESRRLTRKLAEGVKRKLRGSGRTLIRDSQTGRYTIVDLPAAQRPEAPARPTPTVSQQAEGRRSFWSRLFRR